MSLSDVALTPTGSARGNPSLSKSLCVYVFFFLHMPIYGKTMAYQRRYRKRPMRRPMRRLRRRAPPRRMKRYGLRKYNTKFARLPQGMPGRLRTSVTFGSAGLDTVLAAGIKDFVIETSRQPFFTPVSAAEPQAWDQFRAFYKQYRVTGMSLDILMKVTGDQTTNVNIYGYWSNDVGKIGSRLGLVENKYTKRFILGANSSSAKWKTFARPWTSNGMSRRQWMDNPLTISDFLSDPAYRANYFINVFNSGPDVTLNWEIRGKLYVELSNTVTLVDST